MGQKFAKITLTQRSQCILFSVVFTPPSHSHHGSVWLLPVISLLTNTVSVVRACLSIWLERFYGTQKENECGPFSIQSFLHWPETLACSIYPNVESLAAEKIKLFYLKGPSREIELGQRWCCQIDLSYSKHEFYFFLFAKLSFIETIVYAEYLHNTGSLAAWQLSGGYRLQSFYSARRCMWETAFKICLQLEK